MPFAQAPDGHRIHYRQAGEAGPWVVLIQGLTLSGRFWFEIPERLAERGHRVLWLDNRGTGKSDPIGSELSMRTMASDVVTVLDQAGAERATVVGLSMGGMIAQHVALDHGARVEGLVLMATTCGLPHGRLPPPSTLWMLAQLPFTRGSERGMSHMAKLLLPPKEQPRVAELFSHWPAAFLADPQRKATFFHQIGSVLRHSTGSRLRQLTVPTEVITGAEDRLVLPANSRVLAQLIPSAKLEVLPDVAHSIPTLDRDVVLRALDRLRARA